MPEIHNLPAHLRTFSRQQSGTDFTGYIPPGQTQVLGNSEQIPVKEVKIHNNVAVLQPGEAALSGNFQLCSAVIAKKGDQLFVMHIYPQRDYQFAGYNPIEEYFDQLFNQKIVEPTTNHFDQILLIGREAATHQDNFARISQQRPQVIQLNEGKEGFFHLVVYNDPHAPGEITSFDLWFDDERQPQLPDQVQ